MDDSALHQDHHASSTADENDDEPHGHPPSDSPAADGDAVDAGDDAAAAAAAAAAAPGVSSAENPPMVIPPDQSVFTNPPSLGLLRQRLFEMDETVELSGPDFERYWPFVDNIWLRNRAAASSKDATTVTEWYQCRLRKSGDRPAYVPKPTPEGKVGRKKRVRDNVSCGMTLKVVRMQAAPSIYRIMRGCGKDVRHSHDLDYVDSVKRNSGIMDTARREGIKGYQPSSTFHRMWAEPDRMLEAGGKFLKVSDCRNVTMAWRTDHPDLTLKVHSGFAAKLSSSKTRHSFPPTAISQRQPPHHQHHQPPPPPPHPPHQPPPPGYETATATATATRLAAAPAPLPQDTLQYPSHARDFLEPYLPSAAQAAVRKTPHVTLTYASSLDSRIALAPGFRTVLSGPESRAMTHYLRYRHDAILIGVGTAIADDPALNCRLEGAGGYGGKGWARQPRPIIVDPHARLAIHKDMKMLQMAKEGKAKAPWIIIASNTTPHQEAVRTLKAHYGEYIKVHYGYHPGEAAGFDWAAIFAILHSECIRSVMVEGGARVLGQLLTAPHAGLVDSVIVTVAPTYLGKAGLPVGPDSRYDAPAQPVAMRLREVKWQPMGQEDVILCGKFDRPSRPHPKPSPNGLLDGIHEFSQQASPHAVPNGAAPVPHGLLGPVAKDARATGPASASAPA